MKTAVNRHALPLYFFLAYAISWLIWLPLVLSGQGWVEGDFSPYLHALGFMGPMLAAVVVTGVARGLSGIQKLLSGLIRFRINWRWYAFVLLVPPLLFIGAAAINYLALGKWPNWQGYGRIDDLFPGMGLLGTAVLHFLIVGVGEEVGWRGFALPRLQIQRSALRATLILSIFWGFWHLPTFLFENSLWSGLGMALFFVLITFPVAVIYTWLYNGSGGSLLITSLWSTLTTLVLASATASGIIPIVFTIFLIIIAMILANKQRVGSGTARNRYWSVMLFGRKSGAARR